MNDFRFTPTEEQAEEIPFFEDARADYAPYYSSGKTIEQAKSEVIHELAKLDAQPIGVTEGFFGDNPKRHGFEIKFYLHGATGLIRVAGLPVRSYTKTKLRTVKVQALLNVRDWLKAAVTQPVFSPGSHPLIMNMLVPGTDRPLGDLIMEKGMLALEPGAAEEVIDAEFTER